MKKLLTILFLFGAVRLLAIAPVPFTEPVNFTTKIAGTLSSTLTVYGESTVSVSDSVSSGTHESAITTVYLKPGKVYPMNMAGSSTGTGAYQLSFTAPQGYAVYINDLPADLYEDDSVSGSYNDDHTLEIRPMGAVGGGEWGAFSGLAVGEAIAWEVGLGDLRTGRSAGGIQFREANLAGSPASRDRLFYAVPANVGQIFVIKDGVSNQVLRQISTPIGFTDLVDVTNGYEIRFYDWSGVGWNGTRWTFSNPAWKTIKVESTSANQLKITETQGSVSRVSELTGTGISGATGGTVTTSGGYTIHTFNASGTLSVSNVANVDVLVIAGGGGGGGQYYGSGGGGAGGVVQTTLAVTPSTGYSVTVGTGGAVGAAQQPGSNGGNSVFNGITATGGGGGAGIWGQATGSNGGSGGGGAGYLNSSGGSGNGAQGFSGGSGGTAIDYDGGGGGGGAQGAGANGVGDSYSGVGGSGMTSSITGSTVAYAGGGGGGFDGPHTSGGYGGYGGGGDGAADGWAGANGVANTGGGGGGGCVNNPGGNGGSGVVIIRYPTPGAYNWTLQEGSGGTWLRTTTHTISVPASGQRDDVVVVRTGGTSGTIVAKTKYHYVTKAWGEEVTQIVADPDTAALTTTYTYYETAPTSGTDTHQGHYRRVKSITEPTGNWVAYDYYDDFAKRGQLWREYHPYLDSPSTVPSTLDPTTGRVVELGYDYDWTGRYRALVSREVKINNVLTAKTTRDQDFDYSTTSPRNRFTQNDFSDNSTSPAHFTQTYVQNWREDVGDADFVGHPIILVTPNVAQTTTSVSRGTYNPTTKAFGVGSGGDHWRVLRFNGSYTSADGANAVTSFDSQACDSVYMLPNKSTVDVTIRIQQGYVYRTETWVWTGTTNGFKLMTSADYDYDAYGHVTQIVTHSGATTTYTYTDGRLTSTTDPTGTETQFTYDLLGRVATTVKKGASAGTYAAQGDITTTNTYDGVNHVTQTVTGSSPSLTSSAAYDLAGRLTNSTAPGSYTTSYAYTSNGKIVTATLPGGATRISEVYLDGQAKSQTGTAVVAQYFGYTVNSSPGTITQQVTLGTSGSSDLVKSTTDWLGRVITEVRPGWNGSDVTRTWTYDTYYGYLTKLAQPGLADTLYFYDTMGGLKREGLDVGANGTLDNASTDRITERAWEFFSTATGVWWQRQTTSTYATSGSGTATQVAKTETQLSGFTAAGSGYTRLGRTDSFDIFGNVVTNYSEVKRANKLAVATTVAPNSSTNGVQIAYNGLLVSSKDITNKTMTYGYDALGRQTTAVDPRIGTTTTAYVSGTSLVYSVTDPASVAQATYTYDAAGRVATVTNGLSKVSRYSYTDRSEPYRVWGDTEVPVEYAYDNWGRRITMKTYRAGTGWTGSTWPGSPSTADITTWNYQETTGLLAYKEDALTGSSHRVNYTYTQAGQIDVRTWTRGVTTDYGYSSTTGELLTVDYSDSTTDLTYTYNRLGKMATVADFTGTRTLNYNLSGTLEQQNEDMPSFFSSKRITYGYDTATGVIGRPNALQLGTSGSPTADQSITYGYETSTGRFNSLAGGGRTFGYTYTTNSNLLASIANTASGWAQTRSYLSNRDLLDVIETKISTTSKAKFDYALDNLGRRTSVAKTGEMFARYGNGTQGLDTTWGYDDRSQVTSEVTKLGGSGTVLTGRDDGYAYDTMGNRSSTSGTTHNGNTANYTTNALNQYTQRTVPGVFDVAGAAGSGTTITVNGSNTGVTRHGEYFFKGHALTNTSTAVFTTLAVSDGSTTSNLYAFLALTPEPFVYDADGNMTSDGRWDYVYDAENRLVSMQTHATSTPYPIANADARRIEFKNDYLGRRVQKTVRDGWNGSTFATVISDEKFVYDGWNMIARLNALSSNALVASYFWGLDWSGTLQGAGGVGGLLMVQEGGNSYLPMFDGNGNVMGMITAASVTLDGTSYSAGDIVAAYEYDAFGQTLRESGKYAGSNPFRFSTKYTDIETGLVYYGHRYYSPRLGRFICRDPKEEDGGRNLYAFLHNNTPNHYDILGWHSDDGWTLFGREGSLVSLASDLFGLPSISGGFTDTGFSFSVGFSNGSTYSSGFSLFENTLSTYDRWTNPGSPAIEPTYGWGYGDNDGQRINVMVDPGSPGTPASSYSTTTIVELPSYVTPTVAGAVGAAAGTVGFVQGAGGAVGDTVVGTVNTVLHPIDTVQGVADTLGTGAYYVGTDLGRTDLANGVTDFANDALNTPQGAQRFSRGTGAATVVVLGAIEGGRLNSPGGENARTALGRRMHRDFAERVKQKPGWQSEPRLVDPATGKTVIPDAVTPSGKPVELKPNTDSGRVKGKRQLPKYERATGKNGRVIYYEP